MANIEIFMTDTYKVLKLIKEHQIEIGEETYSPLSQQEMGTLLGFSKVKANTIIKELIDNKFIECPIRGKYIVTSEGEKVLEKIQL